MIDPVRFRYAASRAASRSPANPPARNCLPPTSSAPNASYMKDDTHPNISTAPMSFVYAASSARHQK